MPRVLFRGWSLAFAIIDPDEIAFRSILSKWGIVSRRKSRTLNIANEFRVRDSASQRSGANPKRETKARIRDSFRFQTVVGSHDLVCLRAMHTAFRRFEFANDFSIADRSP